MIGAIAQRQYAEDNQRRDLHDVDGQVDGRRSTSALRCDPRHKEREHNRDQRHEDRSGVSSR